MSVGGKVMCRCFLEGRTTPPPVPLDQIRANLEEGWLYSLDGPGEAFEVWLEDCCPHPNLVAAEFDVSWGRLSGFRRALVAAGAAHFPTLAAQLPTTNDGMVLPEVAAAMLAEVLAFQARGSIGLGAFLVDPETGEDVGGGGPSFDGNGVWVVVSPGYEEGTRVLGYDVEGLFLRAGRATNAGDRPDLFRARGAELRPLDPGRAAVNPVTAVEYLDVVSGRTAIGPKLDRVERGEDGTWVPRAVGQLAVERREVTASEYVEITDGLAAVCAASVEIGHPIFWT